jgi:hypothetical protein
MRDFGMTWHAMTAVKTPKKYRWQEKAFVIPNPADNARLGVPGVSFGASRAGNPK